MAERFDLVVIGGGSAAKGVAVRASAAGWRVAMADFRPFGGTCALRGCDPKKILAGATEAIDHVRRMQGQGIEGEARIDWPALMAFKRRYTDPIPARTEESLAGKAISIRHGRACFTAPDRAQIAGESIEARHFVIAAGAEPVRLGIPGEEHVVDHERFLALERMPGRLVFIGGGYIAAELSHIAARSGARVTVLQRGSRMLPQFDPDLVAFLMEAFRRAAIDVRLGASVEAVVRSGDGFRVRAASTQGDIEVDADLVVHAAGRKPDLESLRLPAAGIAVRDGRLALNEFLQSETNPRVYAAGDAAQNGPPLTPIAGRDAEAVAHNLLHGNASKPDYRGAPSVAFTTPPIAAVGLTEAQAREQGLRFRTNHRSAADWYTARRLAQPVYGFKVLVAEEGDRILGAHLVGPQAEEVINLFALAIRAGLGAADLRSTILAYPSAGSDVHSML